MNATIRLEIKGEMFPLTLEEVRELQKTLLLIAGAALPDNGHYAAVGGSVVPINWRDNPNWRGPSYFLGT